MILRIIPTFALFLSVSLAQACASMDRVAGLVVRNINPNLSADNSTNSSNKTPVLGARANASAPTWTDGNQVPLSKDVQ